MYPYTMAPANINPKTTYTELMAQVEKNILEAARRLVVKTAELTQEHEDRQAALAKRAEYLKEKNRIMMRKAGTRQMEAAMEQGNQAMKTREATLAAKYLKENQQALTEKKSKAEDEDWVMVDGMEDWEILRGLKALELSSSSQ